MIADMRVSVQVGDEAPVEMALGELAADVGQGWPAARWLTVVERLLTNGHYPDPLVSISRVRKIAISHPIKDD